MDEPRVTGWDGMGGLSLKPVQCVRIVGTNRVCPVQVNILSERSDGANGKCLPLFVSVSLPLSMSMSHSSTAFSALSNRWSLTSPS